MTNAARIKGTSWENTCKDYLISQGLWVEREDFSSPLGDLRGLPVTIECKARKSMDPAEFLTQVKKSDAKTKHGMYVVLSKKRMANVKDGYFLTDIEKGTLLLKAYCWAIERGFLDELEAVDNNDLRVGDAA
jgi:hypothetical protein